MKIYYKAGDYKNVDQKVIVSEELEEDINDIEELSTHELIEVLQIIEERYKGKYIRISMKMCIPPDWSNEFNIGVLFYGERLETEEEYDQRIEEISHGML